MKLGKLVCAMLLSSCLALSACSVSPAFKATVPSSPSFKKDRDQLLSALQKTSSDYSTFAALPYKKVALPLDDYFVIDETSPVMQFPGGFKSYSLAIALPEMGDGKKLSFVSIGTTNWVTTGGVFSPEVYVLDENYRVINKYSGFMFDADDDANWQMAGIKGNISLPVVARYLVIATTPKLLAERSAYGWDGSRTYSITRYEEAIKFLPGEYGHPDGGNFVVKAHLPVGRIWLGIK